MVADCLCDQPSGIGEVDEPRLGTKSLHHPCLFNGNRDSTQCHRYSTWSSSFLARVAICDRSAFVMSARPDSTDPDTVHHKRCTIYGIFD
jgi:hypothetical protein